MHIIHRFYACLYARYCKHTSYTNQVCMFLSFKRVFLCVFFFWLLAGRIADWRSNKRQARKRNQGTRRSSKTNVSTWEVHRLWWASCRIVGVLSPSFSSLIFVFPIIIMMMIFISTIPSSSLNSPHLFINTLTCAAVVTVVYKQTSELTKGLSESASHLKDPLLLVVLHYNFFLYNR